MNKEEAYNLEKGQEVFVRAIFTNIQEDNEIRCITEDADGIEWSIYADMEFVFTALPTANENATENKPKYDPCRPFKKGDKVKRRTVFGRTCNAIGSLGVYTVIEDEKENSGNVIIVDGTNVTYKVKAVFLELVTPVEELEPYYVKDVNVDTGECFETESYEVRKDGVTLAAFFCYNPRAMTKEQAKAAAEAERDRLNAKSRKEQEK